MLERFCLLHYTTQNNQHKRRDPAFLHTLDWIIPVHGTSTKREQRRGNVTSGLRLLLGLLCLCAFGLSACGQNASSTPLQTAQSQGQTAGLTYVALGASDTFGTGTNDPYTQNWPSDMASMLKQNVHLINLGIPGITLHDALTSELPIALDAHPALVTVWLAVNDLATNVPVSKYERDLNTLLSRLQAAAPRARIAVGNVPDLTSVPFFYSDDPVMLHAQIAAYNVAIASVVTNHHAILVDLSGQGYDLQAHPEYISNDGLHPSTIGYTKLAMLFYDALRKA
jgi:lysophospholipase L1-like esterase